MGSKVVVTYKRKRLFSRSDHSHVNLHSDTSSERSKISDTFPKQEGPLQTNNTGFGIRHAYSKDNIGEDVLQCENHDSQCCSQCYEKHVGKPKMLYSECAEQKYSSVSNETENFTPEQKGSPKPDVEEITCHLNVLLDGNPGRRYKTDSAGQPKAEEKIANTQSKLSIFKLGSEYEDNCKEILPVSQPPDACSGAEPDPVCLKNSTGINCSRQMKGTYIPKTSTLEETDKLHKDQYSMCNNSRIKRKLTSTLITFCRRSKRNRADIASESEVLPAAGCLVDLNNENVNLPNSITDNGEKEISEGIDNSCSFPAPVPVTSTVVLTDNRQHFPLGEAVDAPNAAARCCEDSGEEQMIQQKVCMDVHDYHHLTTQRLSDEDVMTRRMHSDVSGRGDSLLSLDLTIPPHASHNIDCNLPLEDGSDENQPVETSEILHDSFGSTSKIKEDLLPLPVQHIKNGSPVRAVKGKCVLDSPPVLTGNSSRNNYIQFLPESRSDNMLHLANSSENVSPLFPSSLQPSNLIGLSLQPGQMVDGRPCFPPSYEWLNVQVQPREPFPNIQLSTSDRTQSFSRDKMMLDNILTRARAVRGNRSSFLDKFDYPTTWLEEELDSLWIGVRRHGRGNWDAILRDRRLHFLPWKTPWGLAERWQVEQSRLLCSIPVSQRRYMSPPDSSSENVSSLHQSQPGQVDEVVRLSLGHSHPIKKELALHFMNNKTNRDLQKPVANSLSSCWGLLTPSEGSAIIRDETSSTAALINGSLPHWLRTTAEIPPGPSRPAHAVPSICHSGIEWLNQPTFNCPGTSQQPWMSNRCISTQRRPEAQNGGKAPCSNPPLVVECGKTQPDELGGNKQEDLIIIPSDASSEETISDDHSIRP